ncbi:sensor histidine kinase [Blastococcus litoris]|uniref:sensor histidine kinase n=1 Tax=Blastococcus litoris TaxID=2171622 RepID=UPI000E30167C|nr:HAMP domain-containing sensor histidine kinase [Blastococcus litoris]
MGRPPGPSARLKLALSYAGFLVLAGALLLAVVWLFLLRYVPDGVLVTGDARGPGPGLFVPNRSDLERAFVPRAAAALAFLLLLGLAGGWFLAGRMLAPLTRITEATRLAAQGSLSHRIALPGRQDEFRELADAFDGMLGRLEAHVDEQRRFAANASHELRTPLTVMRTLLDVAREDPDRDAARLVERLHAVTTRAIDLTEALLLLSRAEQGSFAPEPVDLSLVAEEAAETLLPLAEGRGVGVETSGGTAVAPGSHPLLLQLVTNLLHNAVVHNLPAGGTVRVRTSARGGVATLVVESTGAQLDARRVATFTEPFQRGTERVRTDHDGAGLGLAIVERIARAHGGTLALAARPTGGLCVTVRLPAAA